MTIRTWPRIWTAIAVSVMAVSAVGFVVMIFGNAFLFDRYDEYGQVPIPGSSRVQLPAGDVTVTFHTVLVGGGGGGGGLAVPPLRYRITGPDGVDEQLTEDYGATTTVNNDSRVRIGHLRLPTAGGYDVRIDGNLSAYLDPKLAFGEDSSFGTVPWLLAAVFGIAVVGLVAVRILAKRRSPRDVGSPPGQGPGWTPTSVPTGHAPFTASDEGIRVQTLDTLARLRDSGALTREEYEAEKQRVLDGR